MLPMQGVRLQWRTWHTLSRKCGCQLTECGQLRQPLDSSRHNQDPGTGLGKTETKDCFMSSRQGPRAEITNTATGMVGETTVFHDYQFHNT
jgi:hypothetical protein